MRYPGFCGGSYLSAARVIDGEEAINLFPSPVASEGGHLKSGGDFWLKAAPGRTALTAIPGSAGIGRGLFNANDQLYAAIGSQLWYIRADFTQTPAIYDYQLAGAIQLASTPVQIFQNAVLGNGAQLFIVSGDQGYSFDGVALAAAVPALMGGFIDGYFLAMQYPNVGPAPNAVQFSGIQQANLWDPLDFFAKEGGADRLRAIAVDHEIVWLIGEATSDLFYNSGAALNPFVRIGSGGVLPIGTGAPFSVAQIPEAMAAPGGLIFLAAYQGGSGVIVRTRGQSIERVSNHAVEAAIQNRRDYPTMHDAVGYVLEDEGHVFYSLTFPSAYGGLGATWFYDLTTGYWHKRGAWDIHIGQYRADKARYHAASTSFLAAAPPGDSVHVVQDFPTGKLYFQDSNTYSDAGDPLRKLRTAPHLSNEAKWIFYNSFFLDILTGTPGDPLNPQGTVVSPVVMMSWSDDGGMTFGNEIQMQTGHIGEFRKRCMSFRNGRSRDRVYKIVHSDPTPFAVVDAYLDIEQGI